MNEPTEQQLAILAKHPNAVLHFGGGRPVKKKSKPTVFFEHGFSHPSCKAKHWSQAPNDWWKWEGEEEDNIIAYIPDPDYPQAKQRPTGYDDLISAAKALKADMIERAKSNAFRNDNNEVIVEAGSSVWYNFKQALALFEGDERAD
jgi:hypothetical protein